MDQTRLTSLLHLAERRVTPRLARWSQESQLHARRNAMVASTRLAQRRIEREEVEEYLAARRAPAPDRADGARRLGRG